MIRPVSPRSERTSRPIRGAGHVAVVTVCLVAALLGGCVLTTDRPDPMLDVPQTYQAAPRSAQEALPALDWWRGFHSTELSALMGEAQAVNLDIAAARARVLQADAQARIAGAPLLPALTGNADVVRARSSAATGSGLGGRETTTYSASLSASYEIDFWSKNGDALRSAQQTATASRFNHDVIEISTLTATASAYFQVLAAQDRIAIAGRNIEAAQRIYDAIKQRVEAGTATDLELAQQESVLATQRASVPPLRQALSQNINALATLIARPPESVRIRGGSLNRLAIPRVTPGLPSELLFMRPDIRSAEAALAAATFDVGNARAQFFPSIQLTGQGGVMSSALKNLFTPQAAFYSVAAGLTQPIFDGARIASNFDLQKARQDELLQIYRKTVVASFADVDNALIAIRETTRREQLQGRVVTSSRRAFTLAEARLKEGTIDIVTVLNTQTTLFQAQDVLVTARLARFQAVIDLFRALGGGWVLNVRSANAG